MLIFTKSTQNIIFQFNKYVYLEKIFFIFICVGLVFYIIFFKIIVATVEIKYFIWDRK